MKTRNGFIFAEILIGVFIASIITVSLFQISSRWLGGIKRANYAHKELKDAFSTAHAACSNAPQAPSGQHYTKTVKRTIPNAPGFEAINIVSAKNGSIILQSGIFKTTTPDLPDEEN